MVPFHDNDIDEYVKNFKNFNDELCKVMPDILLATMNMLFAQYQGLKGNEFIPRYNEAGIEKVKIKIFFLAKIKIILF